MPNLSRFRGRITSGLRLRLTLTYLVFFTVLLSFLGIFFRQALRSLYDSQLRSVLTEEWGALRGYLRIEKPKRGSKSQEPVILWYYDADDPEEALIVDRLRQVYLLTDPRGRPLQIGPKYQDLPWDTPYEIEQAMKSKEPVW